ncbi:MAG TPA: alpha,alpha-trehalase TreF [Steroidobacteraceae bacterium]|jgi:alpha,alpha-trehalase
MSARPGIFVATIVLALAAHADQRVPQPPQQEFQDLFVAVETAAIFPDSKVFPDADPDAAPVNILADYHAARPDSASSLKNFVSAHFVLPPAAVPPSANPQQTGLREHIDALWTALTRSTPQVPDWSSLLPLPQPYVVPGGRFRELYYWDTYFTMLGLERSGRRDLLQDLVDDFAFLVDRYGHIPNGTRSYYLSRSQPPFFFKMVGLLSPNDPPAAYAQYLPQLRQEYAYWMQGEQQLARGQARRHVVRLAGGAIVNRYWDELDRPRDESYREDAQLAHTSGQPASHLYRELRAAAESGWDFSSRWFADARTRSSIRTTSIVPVDLNSLLYGLEGAIRAGCERRSDTRCVREFTRRSAARHAAIDQFLWDSQTGAYYDYDRLQRRRIARVTAASLYPLFVGLASASQAHAVADTTKRLLLQPGGLATTTLNTGEQWDAPNGWAPLQWVAIAGLRTYGESGLAQVIACRWMSVVNDVYGRTGKLVEKYDVVSLGRPGGGGEYPTQDGFGWTNGVMRALIALYPSDADRSRPEQCPAD